MLKTHKIKILLLSLMFNLIPFLWLLIQIEMWRQSNDIASGIAFPSIGYHTDSVDISNLKYYIFKFNYFIFAIYLIFTLVQYFLIISKLNNKIKILLLIFLVGLFGIVLLFKIQYLLPLLLLFNTSLIFTLLFYNYYNKKPNKLIFGLLSFISIIGIVLNQLYNYYTFNSNINVFRLSDTFAVYNEELILRFIEDLNFISSFTKYILYDSLTIIYSFILAYLLFYLVIYLIFKILLKTDTTMKIFFIHFTSSFSILFIAAVGFTVYGNLERNITPLNSCQKDYYNLGLGEDYLDENGNYFEKCVETTKGIYKIYWEVEDTDDNVFNLVEQVEFKKIFILDDNNQEILSIETNDKNIQVYIPTKEDVNNNINNLIYVLTKTENAFPTYSYYTLDGNFLFELPYGLANKEYWVNDSFYSGSLFMVFKDDELEYYLITDNVKGDKYVYNVDGTRKLVEE